MEVEPGDMSRANGGEANPPLRAFARGTGLLLQTLGFVLFISTCCICSLAGQWESVPSRAELLNPSLAEEQPASDPPPSGSPAPTDLGTSSDLAKKVEPSASHVARHTTLPPTSGSLAELMGKPVQAGMMLMAMFMTVGGLALVVFGLGMQSEKRGSGTGALIVVGGSLLVLILAGIGLWSGPASWLARLWHGLVFLVLCGLLPFVFVSWRQMRAHPPPDDLYVVDGDFDVDTYKRSIRQTRVSPESIAQRRATLEAELRELDRLEQEKETG